ncbi:MAG: hypothetical protein A2528_00240 [Candidatus Staskawiczbacteria bacterium RIFOXYD2_FULL_37_9]|uniref:EamA domain-containing protein n=1 Tax=Candidatus Staskawiczbacteria bacterium RIFOXYB1_FULL_37_44 TaxID=1802223 RepID=A0A1G2IWF0_9BACT|nr:MAG: hypothetical protein A2358_02930 [Candidatus Staskawiczbacteria bacterium RIFOXYB1_FULL_37_44]OGZ83879.1 MAG: hypothetical protein A2416_02645 [Candidatus Staskawiczbacteria bacterium RIFOXYC1_FULL_37_52]OGZ87351.1 MAG: hypothetical protein A2444_03355 [Candidatus Staskawiczbacteria bacterium RIFOXYC2_FULL_37_19]OGZ89386.1 MAG: hypothetical protein A2581_00705 [Candidatus Staskawiczbacteria bacterium RIFOXYD1_FULL_37_110]OGZ94143.1 MAG: hypothetical protein A2528_00240 [Candidatus Stask
MLTWLFVIILAYLFFSLAYLGDKLVLSGPPKPASYTFFVGIFSVVMALLLPFVGFALPSSALLPWIIITAIVYVTGLYSMFCALEKFDVSKVMTTIGATQPIFIFVLGWLFFGSGTMGKTNIFAFVLLLLGSVISSFEKSRKATGEYLKITIFSSLMFSLDYILQKNIYTNADFWHGFIWIRLFVFLIALFFLFSKKARKDIFAKRGVLDKKNRIVFFFSQTSGGIANVLQSFAIFLAPVAFLPILNSLRGIQYIFLFLIVLFFSVFLPKILKEEISGKIILQKIVSIILIAAGLAFLVF